MEYFKTYMQLETDNSEVIETISSFGMFCMDNPFKIAESVKEPTKRSWYDENGDDEYIPETGLYMSSYENEVKFGFKGSAFGANEKLKSFLEYLRKGMLKIYCEFNKIGRQHVRLKSIKQTLDRNPDSEDILIVAVTFKFNDPITDIKPIFLNEKVTKLG